jgi:hypothetical protein
LCQNGEIRRAGIIPGKSRMFTLAEPDLDGGLKSRRATAAESLGNTTPNLTAEGEEMLV